MLIVKNNTGSPFSGRFDGVDYPFPPGEEVMVPKDAARHIFGLGEADKTATLMRHGWMRASHERDAAMNILNGFSFSQTRIVAAPDVPEANDEPEHESSPHAEGEGGKPVSDGAGDPPEPTLPEPEPEKARGGILGVLGMSKK